MGATTTTTTTTTATTATTISHQPTPLHSTLVSQTRIITSDPPVDPVGQPPQQRELRDEVLFRRGFYPRQALQDGLPGPQLPLRGPVVLLPQPSREGRRHPLLTFFRPLPQDVAQVLPAPLGGLESLPQDRQRPPHLLLPPPPLADEVDFLVGRAAGDGLEEGNPLESQGDQVQHLAADPGPRPESLQQERAPFPGAAQPDQTLRD